MKQDGTAAQVQTLVGYLKVIVMETQTALATSYVDLMSTHMFVVIVYATHIRPVMVHLH